MSPSKKNQTVERASAGLAGLVFGLGLVLSGMSNPRKVRGFLDITGAWDPSLAFVMLGAIGVAVVAFALSKRWRAAGRSALLGHPLPAPPRTRIDSALICGSIAFGVGWGLSGFCPGPALLTIGAFKAQGVAFVLAMAVGMFLYDRLASRPAVP